MKVTIHQPEHMPWLGFFHKINMADLYVVFDNVQYRRRYFQNRNKIRVKDGEQWLTVPVERGKRDDLLIKDVKISNEDAKWKAKNLARIYHGYSKAPCFKDYWESFEAVYNEDHTRLIDLNLALIKFFFEALGIEKECVLASDLDVSGEKGELIFNICRAAGAKTYISGISGRDYLDVKKFEESGIGVVFQEFHHPIYKQLHEPFIPCISVADILFNHGSASLDIINGRGVEVIKEVFE